jgi:dTDP-4-dehydrorhamnose 3,5-epimerase
MNTKFSLVNGAMILEIDRFDDDRGFFEELYSKKWNLDFQCMQVNCSHSKKNVLRGMHVAPFAKLVNCIKGAIFDVVVDVRQDSTTYLKWFYIILNEDNQRSFYIPANCAHGFLALEESHVVYAQDGLYDPKMEAQFIMIH